MRVDRLRRCFLDAIHVLRVHNVVLLIVRFSGIFLVFGYIRWSLYIDLVSYIGSTATGFVVLVLHIVNSLAILLGGVLADRYGRKAMLIAGSIVLTIGLSLLLLYYTLPFAKVILLITTMIVLFGLGDLDDAAAYALLTESIPRDLVGSAIAIFKMVRFAMFSLGSATIPMLGTHILQLITAIWIPLTLLTSLVVRETLSIGVPSSMPRAGIFDKLKEAVYSVRIALLGSAKYLPISMLILYMCLGIVGSYTPHYLSRVRHVRNDVIGAVYAVSDLCQIPASYTTTLLRKLETALRLTVITLLICSTSLALVPYTPRDMVVIEIAIYRTAAQYLLTLLTLITLLIPSDSTRATLYGITYATSSIYGLGSIIGGYIYSTNPNTIYILTAILILAPATPLKKLEAAYR